MSITTQTSENDTHNVSSGITLTKKELLKAWALNFSSEACYNYERLQALGQTNAMVPVIRKLYPNDKERQVKELKKYLNFFNTEPSFCGPVITGVSSAMEEQRANNSDLPPEAITSLRSGLMGPVAGIGDTLQAIIYSILAAIACNFAIQGNIAGPILFEVSYKIIMICISLNMFFLGYRKGRTIILDILKKGLMDKLTNAFGLIGLMVVGGMAASQVKIITPAVIHLNGVQVVFQDILNTLLPSLIPLIITLGVLSMIRRKMKPNTVIAIIFIVGVVCSYAGILAVPNAAS
ncbi:MULTISPECIES: PTS system mannose/fructose/sorbose family transporter subunit IID [Klebsiella/Raoultella group]|uniref:PTS system mannose/fructose/sorbose family transporter subunit IID n=1 Tax=Klebsiella/Raoultella group TaxID=2890311 RepID=UPI0012B8FD0F|nr:MULTISPECIES: PTS system mannose/fructose/sorbose family transporter subunit IID [Klebsiella]MCM6077339.1 PTS system mannose/fructose/sorbose family transporter subunit IID [Klebsiella pneumoniae]MDW2731041.1 PTS system mannose/fructose/sorbose family transporter subunit IID [Raoultella planticola]MBX8921044.1 PTS system mannose/fructose/sorbose family transporter subunit IID [Klebsiella michiganensis]MDV1908982.1 PTS system mannose/fructose/sorbose family transporter subunit IID [Klebsiella